MTEPDEDRVDWKKFKQAFKFTPSEKWLAKATKVFKIIMIAWWLLTTLLAVNLNRDVTNHPELWHFIEGGMSGEQLRDEELQRGAGEITDAPVFLNGTFAGSVNTPPVIIGNRYASWVYETDQCRTYEHFTGLITGRVGAWFMLTFLLVAFRLRLVLWQLKRLKERSSPPQTPPPLKKEKVSQDAPV